MIDITFDVRKGARLDGFQILKKTEHVFHINDGSGAFVTLVEGKNRALLVDTSWGIKDLRSLVEKLISVPYTVVNTHGHPDHCYGNFQFDEVLVPEKDVDVYARIQDYSSSRDEFFASEEEKKKAEPGVYPPLKTVKEGDRFDLGDLHVAAVPLYGHTHGSLGYIIEEEKLLLCGDSVTVNAWLFMKESLSLEEAKSNYERLKSFDFEKVLGSHSKVLWPKTLVDSLIQNIQNVLERKVLPDDIHLETIMGYKTAAVFCNKEPGSWIVVPENLVV